MKDRYTSIENPEILLTVQNDIQNDKHIRANHLLITGLCNSRCDFCFSRKELPRGHFRPNILIGIMQNEFELGSRILVLSGGEPTIHPDFIDLVSKAREIGYEQIRIITNGRMFQYMGFLKKAIKAGLSEVIFSIHSHRPNIQDQLTQVEGSYEESMNGLNNCIKLRVDTKINIVVNRYNKESILNTVKFFSDIGVKRIDLLRLMPFGRAWIDKSNLYSSDQMDRKQFELVLNYAKNNGIDVSFNRFEMELFEGNEESRQTPYKFVNEVYSRMKDFKKYTQDGNMMYCYPDRCEFCFLKDFCKALIHENENMVHSEFIDKSGKIDPVGFAHEYIKKYNVKH